ncbi:hypothetical protein J1614_003559 [Plenodomus biglobosus]|nr:hypothetical protein J1614_003559 [Plenodomus biglobosus]
MQHLDPHQRPPEGIKAVYKKYQKMKSKELNQDQDIVDIPQVGQLPPDSKIRVVREIETDTLHAAFKAFAGDDASPPIGHVQDLAAVHVYEHQDMPGLHIVPDLLPPPTQTSLLSRLLHRDLSNPSHHTNIHTHYALSYPPYPSSFFTYPPSSPLPIATPLSPLIHKPLPIHPLLTKKLRWTTLGGQYDWTLKSYPSTPAPPVFPPDTKALIQCIFPETRAEAAIVNLYSPSDTLSLHRDVAEQCGRGLVGLSLGCDGVFVIGLDSTCSCQLKAHQCCQTDAMQDKEHGKESILVLRLRSGSAVYMSGPSRFAWHGVPQIVAGTCPDYLADWPACNHGEGMYEDWRGWMKGKRVNLNVRQMWD